MRRALHYVLKITNRQSSYDFYVSLLGMKVLRHEEFQTGCQATCNGPYQGFWSKTMLGYGDESDHFVLELTYNYGVNVYERGNDLAGIFIQNPDAFGRVEKRGIDREQITVDGYVALKDPDGHSIFLSADTSPTEDPLVKVAISVEDMTRSIRFWRDLARMSVFSENDKNTVMGYAETQCKLELRSLPNGVALARGTGFGRIAFSAPAAQLEEIQSQMRSEGQTILTPLVTLDTPGKASVTVVILADPNSHEICYVGDEGFRELSQVDPKAEKLLLEAISQDFSQTGRKKK